MAPANETAFLEAFDSSDIVRRATCRVIGMLKSQVGDANSSATLRIGGLFFSFSRSSSDDQNARSHDKPTTIPVPLKVTPVPFKVTPVPLNKKSEPFDKTLKKKEENLESSTWTTVRKQHKTKDSSKSNLPACGSSTLPKHASSTSTTSKNTSQHPRPQAKLFAVLKSSASTKITATSAKTSSSTKITSSSAKDAASSTLTPKSYVEVVSSPTPSSLNVAARFAGSNSTEIANMAAPQEVLPAALETCTTVHAPSVSASISSTANTFLSDKERGQVLRGTAITRKLHLEFPAEIQEQLVQIRYSKLLGPDDDELHSLFAMSSSDAFKLKPPELGPALRVLWLDSHHTIMEKKAIISHFLFFSDNEMNE